MLACEHLLVSCAKSKPKHYLQVFQVGMDRVGRKPTNQAWRAHFTHSSCSEGVECKNTNSAHANKLSNTRKHSKSMEIGQSLMRFIIGRRGCTREEIEAETGAKIIILSSRKEDSIIIEGYSVESITKASEKIQMIIDEAVNSRALDYSHFISLPLAIHPELVDKLIHFQNTILETEHDDEEDLERYNNMDAHVDTCYQHSTKEPIVAVELKDEDADAPVKLNVTNIPLVSYVLGKSRVSSSDSSSSKCRGDDKSGIEKSIFIKPQTFHLTILMLKLWNKTRLDAAAEVLQSVSSKVMEALEYRPILIKLKGLECMKGSVAKARVLYAPVEEIGGEDRLLRAIQVIVDAFIEAGLIIESDLPHKLKLHATIMNARHRKRTFRNHNTRSSESFNATGIFDLFGSEYWGEYPILEAHLSERFTFDPNGYYHCCASIPFPDNIQME